MAEKKISIQSSIIWNSVGSIVYMFTQWLISIIVVRMSGVSVAGDLTLAMSVNNIYYSIAMFGIRNYQVSDVKNKYSDGTYIFSRIVSCCASFCICIIYCICISYTLNQKKCIAVYCLFKMTEALYDVYAGICQKNWRMDFIGKSWMLKGILTFLGFGLTLYFTSNLIYAILCMSIISFGVILFYDILKVRMLADIKMDRSGRKSLELMKECFPLLCYLFLSTIIPTIPRIVMERLCGSYSLGIYGSISAPTVIVQMGASYIFSPFMTVFAEQYTSGQTNEFWKTLKKCILGIIILSICALIGGNIFGKWGLNLLYGKEVAVHVELLQPLIICTILTALVWFLCGLLTVVRDFKALILCNTIAMVISCMSSFICIKNFDVQGASIALIVSSLIEITGLIIFLYKKVNGLKKCMF